MKNKIAPLATALALVFTLGVSASFAGIFTWNDTNGNWAADSNWQGATAPSGADNTDVLNFGNTQGTGYTANNDLASVPAVVNAIAGNSSSSADQINLTGNQVQLAGTTPEVAQNGSGLLNVQNDLALGANTTLGGSGSGDVILGGAISGGNAGLTKTTSGVATLTGSSSYAGGTVVNAGTLVVNNSAGSGTGTGSVTVNAGATVKGSGTISGAVNVNNGGTLKGTLTVGTLAVNSGGDISPGNSPGTMNAGNTTISGGGKYTFEVNDFAGTAGNDPGWDLLNINGTLALSGASPANPFIVQLDSLTGSVPGLAANFNQYGDYSLVIATASGGISGFAPQYFTVDRSGFLNPNSGFWTVSTSGGGDDLDLNYTAVPEPSMAMLWLSGFGIFAFRFFLHRRSSVKTNAI